LFSGIKPKKRVAVLVLLLQVFLVYGQFIPKDPVMFAKASELAQKFIIVDGHVDLPYRLRVQNFRFVKEFTGIPIETHEGDFDFKRARQGGLDAPFMSIYIPASYQTTGGAAALADSLIEMVEYIATTHPDYFTIAKNPNDVILAKKEGKIALPMGMENGAPVEDDLRLVRHFKEKGISYITLTHSKDNKICDSSYDTTQTWKGISPYGFTLLDEMVRQGIMIDISHISDNACHQVFDYVKVPVIASHSSVRKYTPGFERNISDTLLLRLKKNGGVVMINFGTDFLDGEISKFNNQKRNELHQLLLEKKFDKNSEEGKNVIADFTKKYPTLFSDVYMVADHIDHVVRLIGIEHVGLGSDYDGVGDSLPVGLKDVADYPNLLYVLLERGYAEADIEAICYKNLFRVWNQVLEAAE
jgi:membrane dipeptidase